MSRKNTVKINDRDIIFTGDVDHDALSDVSWAIININKEDSNKELEVVGYKREPINIYICSPGGMISSMFGIIDAIENSKTPVHTYAIGEIQSAAVSIFISGHKRFCYENTIFMIHQVSGGVCGTSERVSEYASRVSMINKRNFDYILSKTKISKELIDDICTKRQDYSFYPDTAIELGITDEIIKKEV